MWCGDLERQTDKQRDRQTERETYRERQADRERETFTDTQIYTEQIYLVIVLDVECYTVDKCELKLVCL